ncbi:MAG: dockerin type I repeat-containing protein [Caldilineaceae bacterium]
MVTATFTQDVVVPSGDINGDASVNGIDLQLTTVWIQAGEQPNTTLYALEWWQRADLNHDSQWNVLDLQLLINLIFAANAALVAPQDRLGTYRGNTVTTGLETSGSFLTLARQQRRHRLRSVALTCDASLGIQITGVQRPVMSGFTAVCSFATVMPICAAIRYSSIVPHCLNIPPGSGATTISYTTPPNTTGSTPSTSPVPYS